VTRQEKLLTRYCTGKLKFQKKKVPQNLLYIHSIKSIHHPIKYIKFGGLEEDQWCFHNVLGFQSDGDNNGDKGNSGAKRMAIDLNIFQSKIDCYRF